MMRDYSIDTSKDELSARQYNLAIGAILLWGFFVNAVMCIMFTGVFETWNLTAIIIGYFVVAFAGITLSIKSDNALVSFIGYNLVVLPVGVVLSLFLKEYETYSILNTFFVAGGVTLLMIVLSTIYPKIFLSMGKVLFAALIGVIVVELIMMFIGYSRPTLWDWGVALLFCAYIGYDWADAQEKRKNLDNAVDSCVGLYLDIINLFIRILAASGNKSSK